MRCQCETRTSLQATIVLTPFCYLAPLHVHINQLSFCTATAALVKQVNPHWRAYFFVTDDNPFETELKSILKGHKDSRLEFLDVPLEFRPSVRTCMILFGYSCRCVDLYLLSFVLLEMHATAPTPHLIIYCICSVHNFTIIAFCTVHVDGRGVHGDGLRADQPVQQTGL